MDESHAFSAKRARISQRSARLLLFVALAAFLLGAAAAVLAVRGLGWSSDPEGTLELRQDESGSLLDEGSSSAARTPIAEQTQTALQNARRAARRVNQVAQQQGGLDQRVAAMEQRLARLDLQAQAAAGNAARAEGLLIAFAARRSIERGAPLGYLADQLRLRFGDALPNAVQTIVAAGDNPITLDQLLARLDGLAPLLSQTPSSEGVLPWLGREISQLFVIRTEDTPSPRAENRLERARLFLESGRTQAAISEVRNLPGADAAGDWIADAARYSATQRALELVETTAVLEPRELRDGSGNRIEQPSPAG